MQSFCSDCRHPTVRLSRFEGPSSRDATSLETTGVYELQSIGRGMWVLATMPLVFLGELLPSRRARKRRQAVTLLKRRVLPEDPEARVCPHCLRVAWSFERLG